MNLVVSRHGNSGIRGIEEYIDLSIWLYTKRRRSTVQIAKVFKCHPSTIQRLLRENNIPTLHNNKPNGARSNFWKGGKTALADAIRTSATYKNWRKEVFLRDNYTCTWCSQKGGQLNADHIKPQSLFPELRFKLSNGRTLCRGCHAKTRTYGEKVKRLTRADFLGGFSGLEDKDGDGTEG